MTEPARTSLTPEEHLIVAAAFTREEDKLVAIIHRLDARAAEQREAFKKALFGSNFPWAQYEILVGYMPPYPQPETTPSVVIRHTPCGCFLRYSKGPQTGTFWDLYGDDFLHEELALVELANAPPCPFFKSDAIAVRAQGVSTHQPCMDADCIECRRGEP